MLLRDIEYAAAQEGAKAIDGELERGNTKPDIKRATKMLSLVSRLYSVFDNIRSSNPASDKVITANVVHTRSGEERSSCVGWTACRTIVVLCPLSSLTRRRTRKLSRLPLAGQRRLSRRQRRAEDRLQATSRSMRRIDVDEGASMRPTRRRHSSQRRTRSRRMKTASTSHAACSTATRLWRACCGLRMRSAGARWRTAGLRASLL